MNIYVLSRDPVEAAFSLCDQHICVGACDIPMLMAASVGLYGCSRPPASKLNTNWYFAIAHSPATYEWVWHYARAVLSEYESRFNRHHAHEGLIVQLDRRTPGWSLASKSAPLFPITLPFKYRLMKDAVIAYRTYYRDRVSKYGRWKFGTPEWIRSS